MGDGQGGVSATIRESKEHPRHHFQPTMRSQTVSNPPSSPSFCGRDDEWRGCYSHFRHQAPPCVCVCHSGAPPSSFLPPCAPTPLASKNYGFGPVLKRRSGRLPFALFCLLASVGIAVCLVFKQIRDTGVHLFVVTLTMVLALVLSQACYLVDELCHLQERHGGRCWPAVLLCLRFPPATYLTVGVLMLLSVLMALQHWDMVLGFLRDQCNLLLLMGLVCQLCTWWASKVQWQRQHERRETAHVGEGMA